jgi:hypothetical protein
MKSIYVAKASQVVYNYSQQYIFVDYAQESIFQSIVCLLYFELDYQLAVTSSEEQGVNLIVS